MPFPIIKEYPKTHLRAILHNSSVDTTDKNVLDNAPMKSKPRFYKQVLPVIEKHCTGIISLDEFKRLKIVPEKVVKVLFEKLL